MTATGNRHNISAARADALFVSALQPSGQPSARQVRQAVAAVIRQFGHQSCAERVAQEFGEHPELAAARMRWTQLTISGAFGGRTSPQRRPRQADSQRFDRAA